MKCYQKAFTLGNEYSDENFKDEFEMTKFWCPEQFFKDYGIEIEPSNCKCIGDLNLSVQRQCCKECWNREYKPLKGDM